jgi:hypothetical protein
MNLGSCPVMGFCIGGVEPTSFLINILIVY